MATFLDVIDGSAHMMSGRQYFRVHEDPETFEKIVCVYPASGMPDCVEKFRLGITVTPRGLAKAMREHGYDATPRMDD